MAEWHATATGTPSEGGVLVRHEEYWEDTAGAGITLERDSRSAPAAITCGIYGWMVHTRYFASVADAEAAAQAMKPALEDLVKQVGRGEPPGDSFRHFVDRFPT